tara:strand:- start:487 stop:768 length:282 start_codon:yes stop_codon:yes gene_type:complete
VLGCQQDINGVATAYSPEAILFRRHPSRSCDDKVDDKGLKKAQTAVKVQSGLAAVHEPADAPSAICHKAHNRIFAQSATRAKQAILNNLNRGK